MRSSLQSAKLLSQRIHATTNNRLASHVRLRAYTFGVKSNDLYGFDHQVHPNVRSFSLAVTNEQIPTNIPRDQIITNRVDDEPLPRTLEDALRQKSRATVITEKTMPFAVFNVNRAWENLCGYTNNESKGKSLDTLLQGPETDPVAVTALLNQLLRGEDATTVLVNYKKSGERFLNRLHVGPLYDDNGDITHYVGVLQQLAEK